MSVPKLQVIASMPRSRSVTKRSGTGSRGLRTSKTRTAKLPESGKKSNGWKRVPCSNIRKDKTRTSNGSAKTNTSEPLKRTSQTMTRRFLKRDATKRKRRRKIRKVEIRKRTRADSTAVRRPTSLPVGTSSQSARSLTKSRRKMKGVTTAKTQWKSRGKY